MLEQAAPGGEERDLPLWEVTIQLCHLWPSSPAATGEGESQPPKAFGVSTPTSSFRSSIQGDPYAPYSGTMSQELCPHPHPIPREERCLRILPPAAAGVASWAVKLLFRSQIQPKFPSAAAAATAAAGRNEPHLPGSRRSSGRDGIDKIPGRHGEPACQTQPINVSPFPCQPIKLCVLVTSAGKRGWRARRTRFQGSLEDLKNPP